MSVADQGHSSTVISSNQDVELLKHRYTFTSRYQDSSNYWLIGFQAKDKAVTLKEVMGTSYPVTSGIQLWHNIVTHMEQTMMEDLNASSVVWKTAKNNAATISLKSTWKPTFEWKEDTLILKGVSHQDVYARDAQLNIRTFILCRHSCGFRSKIWTLIQRQIQPIPIKTEFRLCLTQSDPFRSHPTD